MTYKLVCALAALLLATSVCLAADKPAPNDNLITDQVRIKLASDPDVKGGALEVNTAQGIVTITGNVENSHARDKATKLAKKVRGVKEVINKINVKEKPGGR